MFYWTCMKPFLLLIPPILMVLRATNKQQAWHTLSYKEMSSWTLKILKAWLNIQKYYSRPGWGQNRVVSQLHNSGQLAAKNVGRQIANYLLQSTVLPNKIYIRAYNARDIKCWFEVHWKLLLGLLEIILLKVCTYNTNMYADLIISMHVYVCGQCTYTFICKIDTV